MQLEQTHQPEAVMARSLQATQTALDDVRRRLSFLEAQAVPSLAAISDARAEIEELENRLAGRRPIPDPLGRDGLQQAAGLYRLLERNAGTGSERRRFAREAFRLQRSLREMTIGMVTHLRVAVARVMAPRGRERRRRRWISRSSVSSGSSSDLARRRGEGARGEQNRRAREFGVRVSDARRTPEADECVLRAREKPGSRRGRVRH